MSRRALLLAAAGAAWPAQGQAGLPVPEVDSLTVRVLVDNAAFVFAEPVRTSTLRVDRAPRSLVPYQRTLAAEFGLSLLAESRRGDDARTVMIDFGYTSEALLNNMDLLGVDPGRVDAAVLSHGHYDHFGGLNGLLADGRVRTGTPLYVGGEEAFCARERIGGTGAGAEFGALDRAAIRAAGLALNLSAGPAILAGHGFTTGHIPLESAERAAIPTRMRPGQGCERSDLSPSKRDADLLADDGEHELGTAYVVRDRGLVVIGSCSHRGILNTIRRARAISGVDRLHAVMGGFHLVAPRTPQEARATVAELKTLNPDYIVPGHCTGETFIESALAEMPGKVIRPYVGSSFTFGATV